MDRISGPGATPDNLFTEGDPSLGVDATTVTANWLNGVQEELIHILEEGGVTPDGATLTQVLEALQALFVRKDVPENTTVRNLLTLNAQTGSLPANGVFSWGALHVPDSTDTGLGAANNIMTLAANAYWDGDSWVRRAGGPSVAIQLIPGSYAIHLMDGGAGFPGDAITWTARAKFVLNGRGRLYGIDIVDCETLDPVVAETTWTSLVSGITSTVKSKKMPDNTLHTYGRIDKAAGVIVSPGTPLLGITGDPFGIGDGKFIWGIGFETAAPSGFSIKYNATANQTQLVYYTSWDSSAHFLSIWQVVPCLGL